VRFREASDMDADLTYLVVLEPEGDGRLNVVVPALPEAHTWGDTPEQALANAREVIQALLEDRRAHGEDIPPSDAPARIEHVTVRLPAA